MKPFSSRSAASVGQAAGRRPFRAVLVLAFLALACTDPPVKGTKNSEPKPAPVQAPVPTAANGAAKEPAVDPAQEAIWIVREANILFTQSDYDAAKIKVEEGLALSPQDRQLLSMQSSISSILSHRCCGKWFRYDFSKPEAGTKHLSGVLYSKQVGQNSRGHDFRGRVLIACEQGSLSMHLRVPWELPAAPSVTLEYKLGEAEGTEKVTMDSKKYVYILPEPRKWIKKLGENEEKVFAFKVPKLDGSVGEFSFELDKAQEITSEVLSICK